MTNKFNTDEYIKNLMSECLKIFDRSTYTPYAYAADPLDPTDSLENLLLLHKNVIIFTVDNWGDDDNNFCFLPESQKSELYVDKIKSIAKKYNNSNIFIFTTMFDFSKLFDDVPNVSIVFWGDDMIVHPYIRYQNVLPVTDKNFQSQKHWIMLSHNVRWHRVLASAFVLGHNYDSTGVIRVSPGHFIENKNWNDFLNYCEFNEFTYIFDVKNHFDIFEKGFSRLVNKEGYHFNEYSLNGPSDGGKMLHKDGLNLALNFEVNLKSFYKHSFLEIIGEPLFIMPGAGITEKYLNSVYGMNFPIMLNVVGSVHYLRTLGFDVFDDVINHDYDNIKNPLIRLTSAITLNKELFEDADKVKKLWIKNQQRFYNNYVLAKSMYSTNLKIVSNRLEKILKVSS